MYSTMKALVYKGASSSPVIAYEDKPRPTLASPSDAIVKVRRTTICGTDLHILKGDLPECTPGRILGHEGVGEIFQAGDSVKRFKTGDPVLISCITSCGTCVPCRKGMCSHCTTGGWILGHTIDGTQAEFVRIPHADTSLHPAPKFPEDDVSGKGLAMLSDILPTGLECGVLNGKVQPGGTVIVIGCGPVGLGILMTAQLYSPSMIVMVDGDESRLAIAKKMGATHTVVAGPEAQANAQTLTNGEGFDTVIEAVGIPATFEMAQNLVATGGTIANVGVHGTKVDLHLEKLWSENISKCCGLTSLVSLLNNVPLAITTRLVDAVVTPMLLRLYEAGKLPTSALVTHGKFLLVVQGVYANTRVLDFPFKDIVKAYGVFGKAAEHSALKLNIEM